MILTAAIVGAETTRESNPAVPYLPSEIAAEAIRCWEKGASIVHLHARRPDGTPTQEAALFGEAIELIRASCDVIIQVSTGGAVGMSGEERCQPLTLTGARSPEMATLSCGSVNFGEEIFENPRPLMRDIAERIRAAGIKPELEIFDAGMMDEARYLHRKGLIDLPAHFDFVLGVPGALAAREDALDYLLTQLPEGSTWCVAGIGRFELPMVEAAARRGGHARVGFEDNVFLSKGVLAKGSFELVEAAAEIARRHGRRVVRPSEVRAILGIPARA
ncbi:MAG: 3-keto-5-aminohexanoate cleavage protein [Myxococcaceae bacterium]|nr:3-keto-5-aminohexanoate cleavage protein [Myxococcaceae bacterium]